MVRIGLLLGLSAVLGGTIALEAFYGRLAGFSRQQAMIDARGKHIGQLRRYFGEWSMQKEIKIRQSALDQLDCRHYIARRYVHRVTGQTVTVTLLVGRAGPLVVHSPEICLKNGGLAEVLKPRRVNVGDSDAPSLFSAVKFRSTLPGGGEIWSLCSWNAGKGWQAPKYPRIALGAEPVLVKLQIVVADARAGESELPEIASQFLRDFLPVVEADVLARPADRNEHQAA